MNQSASRTVHGVAGLCRVPEQGEWYMGDSLGPYVTEQT